MDIRQLETFVQVAKCKSFSKAADNLFITQPTVTNHVQNLEQELNTLLISRLGRKIKLTEEGNTLYRYALDILNLLDNAKYDLQAFHDGVKGHLTIYVSSVPRKCILPEILQQFSKQYPNITYSIGERDSHSVIDSILTGETDFGILGANYPNQNIEYIKLMEDELVLITPSSNNFPEISGSVLSQDQVFRHRFIQKEEGSGTRLLVENELKKAKISPKMMKTVAYVEDTELIKNLVMNNFGLAILSKKLVESDQAESRINYFYIEVFNFKRNFYFAFHKFRKPSPINHALRTLIIDNFSG